MRQYIVDTFAPKPFTGNPAAVCVMDAWPSDDSMQLLARENSLSETAFLVGGDGRYRLRWFTPGTEVELCGHATLASAFTIMELVEPGIPEVRFDTMSGELVVRREGAVFTMDLPVRARGDPRYRRHGEGLRGPSLPCRAGSRPHLRVR